MKCAGCGKREAHTRWTHCLGCYPLGHPREFESEEIERRYFANTQPPERNQK